MDFSDTDPLLIERSPETPSSDTSMDKQQKSPDAKQSKQNNFNKPPRKRSRVACTWCRDRKVRCDASSHGVPCTNCELDQQECVVHSASLSTRSKKPVSSRHQPYPSPTPSTRKGSVFQLPEPPSRSPLILNTWDEKNEFQSSAPWTTPPHAARSPQPSPVSSVLYTFYPFLNLLGISEIPQEDIQYLSLKGCFFVPAGEVLDEFIRKYFLYVHPCLPVMDEAEFWKMYYHTPSHDFSPHLEACNGETNGINLLAFQAMLFASCPFVSAQALNAVGFPDARSARNIFYTRAKLLYDLCPPNDSLQTIQASILLSQHMPTTNIHTGAVWLSIAIQNAIVYNAFSPSQTPNPGFNEKETEANTKKRVWWCILLRDRIMALGLRRAPLITSDTSIGLEIGAFEGTVPGETDIRPENEKSEVYDPEANRLLARVFGVLCEFVNVLGDVLHVLHSGSNAPNLEVRDGINSQADAKTAQTASTTQARIAESKAALLRWSTNAKGALGAVVNSNTTHESVGLFFGLTFFYYHTARLALSNFEALTLHLHLQSQQETETETETKLDINDDATYGRNQCYLEDSIGCITDTIKRFLAQGVAQYLPIDTMPLIAHPLLLSALDPRLASNKSQAATRKRRFRYYATLMQIYQARYEGTGTVAGFIQRTLQVAEGVVPRVASQTQTQTQTQSRDLHMDVGVSSWSELFVSRPSVYLRLSLLLDVAFRRGWYAYPGYQEIYKMLGTGGKAKNRGPDGINATGMGFMVLRSNVKAGENDTCAGGEASGLVSFDTFLDTSGGMVEKQEQEGGGLHLFSDSGAISIPAIRTSRAQVLDSMALSSYDQAMAAEYAYPLHLQSTLSFSTQGNLDYGYDLDQIQDH